MNNQDAFNIVWQHYIMKRSRRGWDIGIGKFRYRSCEGKQRCVIGILIPDALYHPTIEGYSIDQIIELNDDFRHHFEHCSVSFLMKLQEIHDNSISPAAASDFWKYMEANLREVAALFSLSIPAAQVPPPPVYKPSGHVPQWRHWKSKR